MRKGGQQGGMRPGRTQAPAPGRTRPRGCRCAAAAAAAGGMGRLGKTPARPPDVGGRCAVTRPSAVPGGRPAAAVVVAAAAAACMRSSRSMSAVNLATSSSSPNSCRPEGALAGGHWERGRRGSLVACLEGIGLQPGGRRSWCMSGTSPAGQPALHAVLRDQPRSGPTHPRKRDEVAQRLWVGGAHAVDLPVPQQRILQPPDPPQAARHHERPLALPRWRVESS